MDFVKAITAGAAAAIWPGLKPFETDLCMNIIKHLTPRWQEAKQKE